MTTVEGYSLALSRITSARPHTGLADSEIAALVAQHSTTLFRVANAILRNPAEAEDVVQDTFLRLTQHQHKLPDIRDLRVWLVRIAWNLALDRHRRIRPDQIDDLFAATLLAPNTPADQALHEARQLKLLLTEIDHLPKQERQILLLSALEELTTPELTQITGRSPSAIRALLFRARTRLRTRLQQGGLA